MAEYCLRWNNHQPNLVTVFSELLNAETLVDVTLATDGHFIHAHKLVLSACSVYFKDLFGSNPCKHPIVFLKDIKIEDLKTVIDFIYRGEVNVSQERLQDVLKTAESLRIKGLADKPFSYDEYPSQSRGGGQQHLSSSFSSQRSSLTDSREQQQSGDADDLIDVSGGDGHSPPAHKKRKVAASQDSSDGAQETNNHEEDRHKSNGKEETVQQQKPPSSSSAAPTVNDEGTTTTTPKSSSGSSGKEKQKDEKEVTAIPVTSESRPEFQESRAADAMLMLQGSSSDGGEDGGTGSGGTAPSNTSRTGDSSSLMSSHSQGRGKRGLLQRQPGIIREVATEEPSEEGNASPEYIVPESITLTLATETIAPTFCGLTSTLVENTPTTSTVTVTSSKMLQVPAVVVGPHQDKSPFLSLSGNNIQKQSSLSKSLLVVPSSAACMPQQIMKQRSQPEMSRSYSEGISPQIQIKKEPPSPSHTTVLSHATSVLPDYSSVSSNQQSQHQSLQQQQQQPMTLFPVQLMKKQRSSPGSLPSSSSTSHLRPIQPKPSNASSDREMPKDLPLIHLTTSDDDVGYQTRFPRAISEEPTMSRSLDLLIPGTGAGTLTQSVSQDTGLDGGMAFMNRVMGSQSLTIPKVSASGGGAGAAGVSSTNTPSSVAHSPVLREGPALGCNYCWNSQDNQGRMQRRKTKYHCPACRTNLCIVPCFHEYHSQMQMQQDQHKQITKILTKTSST